jgi:multidrug efflux pump
VRLKDVARVELGLNTYSFDVRASTTNPSRDSVCCCRRARSALDVARLVKERMTNSRPASRGRRVFLPFRRHHLHHRAISRSGGHAGHRRVLGFIVMLVFCRASAPRSFRAWGPWRLMGGAFIGMAVFGFSINHLSCSAWYWPAASWSRHAIVVIESVERIIARGTPARRGGDAQGDDADHTTRSSRSPWCCRGGVHPSASLQSASVGMIYQQFAMTIAISMGSRRSWRCH